MLVLWHSSETDRLWYTKGINYYSKENAVILHKTVVQLTERTEGWATRCNIHLAMNRALEGTALSVRPELVHDVLSTILINKEECDLLLERPW